MVKNTNGGNKGKKGARKHMVSKPTTFLRKSEDDLELYGIATKMLGNNMFHCHCIDNVVRLCHIRGKFTGRKKRDNIISAGSWVLVGLREWDNTDNKGTQKLPQCDILEVYSSLDKEKLKDSEHENWSVLINNDVTRTALIGFNETADINNDIIFSTEDETERQRLLETMNLDTEKKITMTGDVNGNSGDDEIDFDDI